jgi:hypothetical protein
LERRQRAAIVAFAGRAGYAILGEYHDAAAPAPIG